MTKEELDREIAWARKAAKLEDAYGGLDHPGGRLVFLAKKFPIPDTTGLRTEQAEAVLDRWRAEIKTFTDAAERPQLASPATPPTPVAPSAPPEVPTS